MYMKNYFKVVLNLFIEFDGFVLRIVNNIKKNLDGF